MKVDELRKSYLDFFKSKNHTVVASDSLVPKDDPSLLFTGAGMNQFKPYFLGLKKDLKRATSCQKCLRTADLERVGKTAYHHSFFEMLGNFSFGDYFKEEAIAWGWEFVTKALGIPVDNLWVSVYEEDDETYLIWKNKIGISESRIVRMDAVDNFWPSNAKIDGPNGPCGPCSEIYVEKIPGKGVEIWNLVFTQFDRQADGTLKALPQKNIDTGMGLERTASVLQGVDSNFDIDSFQKIREELQNLMKSGSNIPHENAAMDHARAAIFSIADGALPSNEGRGYVVRKLIRLGSDHFEKAGIPISPRTFFKLVPVIVSIYGSTYPEIRERQKTISSIIENEEKAYEESCKRAANARRGVMTADEYAFMLYDTYGLPTDRIIDKFSKEGLSFNEAKFTEYLNEQRDRSRQSSKLAGEIFAKTNLYAFIEGIPPTQFLGYEATESKGAKLLRIIKNDTIAAEISMGEEGILLFDRSPFYAEAGGQIGDAGTVEGNGFKAEVLDSQYLEKCIGHKVRVISGKAVLNASYDLKVASDRRSDIMKNHTATHLLHSALRKILGDHVKQSGSLVAKDYLRFDFTHFNAVDAKTLGEIESMVNAEIKKNTSLNKRVMSKETATKEGAIAFFGEKYGEEVRVVTIGDFSKELCGGTHLNSTGEIGLFKIVSEGSIQAGVRRIEAVTGRAACALVENQEKEIQALSREFGAAKEALSADLKKISERVSQNRNRLTQLAGNQIKNYLTVETSKSVGDAAFISKSLDGADAELMKTAADNLNAAGKTYAALLTSRSQDKISIAVAASADLVKKGFHSGKMVKEISEKVDGNGGGRPDFAIGGGKNISKAAEAIQFGEKQIRRELETLLAGEKLMIAINPSSKKFAQLFNRVSTRNRRVEEKVRRILEDVKNNGDEAVLRYTRKFDRVKLTPRELRVAENEINGAYQNISPDFVSILKVALENVSRFYKKQTHRSWKMNSEEGVVLGERVRPLESVGIYVPSGTAPLPSTVYMTVLPAKLAGVQKVYLITPPNKFKSVDPHILVVANLLKVDGIFKVGGAQAIGAFAFGTKSIPRVDKIIGPGNAYVAEAKRQVFGYCDIDMVAGPTEVVILADDYADPDFVTADLLAQAEHHMGTSILVTTSKRLAKSTKKVSARGYIVHAKSLKQGVEVINQIAPEHVEIMVKNPQRIIRDIKHAGAIFVGGYTPAAVGDYVAGPSHVLPTNGTARFFSGLSVHNFTKSSHIVSYNRKALEKVRNAAEHLASLEGLTKHMESIKIRFEKSPKS